MHKKIRVKPLLTILILSLFLQSSNIFAVQLPRKFPFKEGDALKEWEEKIFRGKVLYSVKVDKNDSFLSAYSKDSASSIFFYIKFDPKKNPMASWKWKVLRFPKKANNSNEGGDWIEQDDYAARFYVIFPKLNFHRSKALEYVWDKSLPVGTIKTSPYSENIKIIVIESGKRRFKKWVFEERNICEDFKSAFGMEPGKVGAIAIMTDTDNTKSTAEANYDEIKVGYKNEAKTE